MRASTRQAKRVQSADMRGMVCLVTGGRIRIGFQICLKLLRAGAYVLTTTRFPADAAARYANEATFNQSPITNSRLIKHVNVG